MEGFGALLLVVLFIVIPVMALSAANGKGSSGSRTSTSSGISPAERRARAQAAADRRVLETTREFEQGLIEEPEFLAQMRVLNKLPTEVDRR